MSVTRAHSVTQISDSLDQWVTHSLTFTLPSFKCVNHMISQIVTHPWHNHPLSKLFRLKGQHFMTPPTHLPVNQSPSHLSQTPVPRQVTHLHPGPKICVSIPSSPLDYHLHSIQVTYHIHSGPKACISPSSMSQDLHLKPLQVLPQIHPCLGVSHPHIDPIWPLSRSRY